MVYKKILFFAFIVLGNLNGFAQQETVTIAILAKDKAHLLEEYLTCLEKQTWPKNKTHLYIRTNNNNDETATVLKNWLLKVKDLYLEIYFDETDVQESVQNYKQHEWNGVRFKVLGKIRQESIDWAYKNGSHYFIADCDNFIKPNTIEALLKTNLPIVAPFLTDGHTYYSNYHAAIDENGYFANSASYKIIFNQEIKGLFEVPVVHCTYLVRYDFLNKIYYDDESYRYEYVIFSDSARKNNIPQSIDNREMYGRITFAEEREAFLKESWLTEIVNY